MVLYDNRNQTITDLMTSIGKQKSYYNSCVKENNLSISMVDIFHKIT